MENEKRDIFIDIFQVVTYKLNLLIFRSGNPEEVFKRGVTS
jgi:hypothetical protein